MENCFLISTEVKKGIPLNSIKSFDTVLVRVLQRNRTRLPLGVERQLPLAKKTPEIRGSMSPASLGSSHTSHYNFQESHCFLISGLTWTVDTLKGWEFNLHWNSASHRMRFSVWFLAILVLWLQEMGSPSRHTEAFRSRVQCLSWEFKSLSSSFTFPTLFSDFRSNHPISCSSVWQNVQKYYVHSHSATCFL